MFHHFYCSAGENEVKKHSFRKEKKKKQPLEDYSDYQAISDPVINLDQLKQGTDMVNHDMGISILLLTTSSSPDESDTETTNLTPEEIIYAELQACIL